MRGEPLARRPQAGQLAGGEVGHRLVAVRRDVGESDDDEVAVVGVVADVSGRRLAALAGVKENHRPLDVCLVVGGQEHLQLCAIERQRDGALRAGGQCLSGRFAGRRAGCQREQRRDDARHVARLHAVPFLSLAVL